MSVPQNCPFSVYLRKVLIGGSITWWNCNSKLSSVISGTGNLEGRRDWPSPKSRGMGTPNSSPCRRKDDKRCRRGSQVPQLPWMSLPLASGLGNLTTAEESIVGIEVIGTPLYWLLPPRQQPLGCWGCRKGGTCHEWIRIEQFLQIITLVCIFPNDTGERGVH